MGFGGVFPALLTQQCIPNSGPGQWEGGTVHSGTESNLPHEVCVAGTLLGARGIQERTERREFFRIWRLGRERTGRGGDEDSVPCKPGRFYVFVIFYKHTHVRRQLRACAPCIRHVHAHVYKHLHVYMHMDAPPMCVYVCAHTYARTYVYVCVYMSKALSHQA